MRILALTAPGRFPTVTLDPGTWWDALAAGSEHELVRHSANAAWWRALCSPLFRRLALEPLGTLARLRRRTEWRAMGLELDGARAGRALEALRTPASFGSSAIYIDTLAPFERHIAELNRAQREMAIALAVGPYVHDLDYDDSATLVQYSAADSLLARTVEASLAGCPRELGAALLSITSPQDLLTALIAARVLRAQNPGVHLCLIDHGYENFSLRRQIGRLIDGGTLGEVFDSAITAKDDRDRVVPALVAALAAGQRPSGALGIGDFPDAALAAPPEPCPPPPPPPPGETFAPEPILWTRLSARRCYWSRCTYCTQNSKYDDPRAPARSEIVRSLDRVEAAARAGYRSIYFSDEALSPATLGVLADEIERRALDIRWACRCKLERAHTAELFERLGRAGCYEILFGLETTSPRVLKLMDKHVEGLDEAAIARAFAGLEAAGIGIHVNLIAGYPGDSAAESEGSVAFLIDQFRRRRGGTYALNAFVLMADTPLANAPQNYGVAEVSLPGDIAQQCRYRLEPALAGPTEQALAAVPDLQRRLDGELGWQALAAVPGGRTAGELYFGSGHGSIFKARRDNPFANPLLAEAAAGRPG